jgi:hypothetical protein
VYEKFLGNAHPVFLTYIFFYCGKKYYKYKKGLSNAHSVFCSTVAKNGAIYEEMLKLCGKHKILWGIIENPTEER